MIGDDDLDAAVRSGAVAPEVALRLRNFAAERRGASTASEERFALVGGLADATVAAGLMLVLGVTATFLASITPGAAVLVAPAAWAFAGHVTLGRRLMLSSFVLFGFWTISIMMFSLAVGLALLAPGGQAAVPLTYMDLTPATSLVVTGGATAASLIWWRRFRLPIAWAGMTLAIVNAALHLIRLIAPDLPGVAVEVTSLLSGIALFVAAMWWDLSDIRRETRRADVAFWLHVMAGYGVSHQSFRLLFGVTGEAEGWGRLVSRTAQTPDAFGMCLALIILAVFALVSLAVDRRSLLLSSLAFLVPVFAASMGGPTAMAALLLIAGIALLMMGGNWTGIRAVLLKRLPKAVRAQLPRTELVQHRPRPV